MWVKLKHSFVEKSLPIGKTNFLNHFYFFFAWSIKTKAKFKTSLNCYLMTSGNNYASTVSYHNLTTKNSNGKAPMLRICLKL